MERFKRSAAVITFASFLALSVAGCESKYTEKVVGTWEWNIGGGTVLVTVNKDGTGSLKGPLGEKNMKWRIQRGNNFVFNDGSTGARTLVS